jgi:hypothetical protein
MTLANTATVIGKVSEWLRVRLEDRAGMDVTIGRPEPKGGTNGADKSRLNLFLYEANFDPSMKNLSLEEGRNPPLWLALKYLLTAFDETGESDTAKAHENLSKGLQGLQELNILPAPDPVLHAEIYAALEENPESLKITFDAASSELLSKLMQGSDEKYRFSMAFQVRPIMIAPAEPPSYNLVVGVDHTQSPPDEIGMQGVKIPILPSLGPRLDGLSPVHFEVGDEITLTGTDLNLEGLKVQLGGITFGASAQWPNKAKAKLSESTFTSDAISAGEHPVGVVQVLSSGRRRGSNILTGRLRPTLTSANASGVAVSSSPPNVTANINLTGFLLGRAQDDVFLALYDADEGQVAYVFEGPLTYTPDQTGLTLAIADAEAVSPGHYLLILRVNGQQAVNSPEVDLTV